MKGLCSLAVEANNVVVFYVAITARATRSNVERDLRTINRNRAYQVGEERSIFERTIDQNHWLWFGFQ